MTTVAFTPFFGKTVSISGSSTSANSNIQTGASTLLLTNNGSKTCYVRWGLTAPQTALLTDLPVLGGSAQTVTVPDGTVNVAAICSGADTTTLLITPGFGI